MYKSNLITFHEDVLQVNSALYDSIASHIMKQYPTLKVCDKLKRVNEVIFVTFCNLYGVYYISCKDLREFFSDRTLKVDDLTRPDSLIKYYPIQPAYDKYNMTFYSATRAMSESRVLNNFDVNNIDANNYLPRTDRYISITNNKCLSFLRQVMHGYNHPKRIKNSTVEQVLAKPDSESYLIRNSVSLAFRSNDNSKKAIFTAVTAPNDANDNNNLDRDSYEVSDYDLDVPSSEQSNLPADTKTWILELIDKYRYLDSNDIETMMFLSKFTSSFNYNRIYTRFHMISRDKRPTVFDTFTNSNMVELVDLHAAASIGVSLYAYKMLGKTTETDKFFEVLMSGEFYENIIEWGENNGYPQLSRPDVKMRVNSVYYASTKHSSDHYTTKAVHSYFETNFPNIYKLVRESHDHDIYKLVPIKDDNKQIVKNPKTGEPKFHKVVDHIYIMDIIQEFELNIVSWTACQLNRELHKRGIPGVVLSLHDALFCSKQLIDTNVFSIFGVKQLLMDKIYSYRDRYRDGIL